MVKTFRQTFLSYIKGKKTIHLDVHRKRLKRPSRIY